MDKTDKEAEEEKLDRDAGLIAVGVVMGVLGGFISNYLAAWSRGLLAGSPFLEAVVVIAAFFTFFILLFMLMERRLVRKSKSILPTLKGGWKWYVFVVGPLCLLIFIALYNNPTSVVL